MRIKNYLFLGPMFLLVGCTYYASATAGRGSPQEQRDEAECHQQSIMATGDGIRGANVEIGCMRLRGYEIYRK
jgi:hypothetical protein